MVPLTLEMHDHDKLFKDAVMLRTYCRDLEDRKEKPEEVWDRVIDSFKKYYSLYLMNMDLQEDWEEDWKKRMSTGQALPAGRMLWSMGSASIEKDGYLPMMNCGFILINDPIEPIKFLMKMLMLGCGMGFSLEKKYFDNLRRRFMNERYQTTGNIWFKSIKEVTETGPDIHVAEDTKEGWVDLIGHVIYCGMRFVKCKFNIQKIRPAGSRIQGFGGRSGDPKILSNIAQRIYYILTKDRYPSIKMYYDIICSVGELVISGNVRRSALIAIGDPDDKRFLRLKRFDNLTEQPWRCYCNNSVNVSSFEQLTEDFWETYKGSSEAYGWVNIAKCKTEDTLRNIDREIEYIMPRGFNPCGEQPLADREVCCLGEVNLSRAESEEDLFQSMKMSYLFCKMSFMMRSSEPFTDRITNRNQRIGISLTGIAMVEPKRREWAYRCRKRLRNFDEVFSKDVGVYPSIALTTVKPGGTLPKIAGSSGPGIHRPISKHQIRRVRFNKNSKLLGSLKAAGLPVEPQMNFDGKPDASGTQVVSFYLENEEPYDGNYSDYQLTETGFYDMLNLISEVQQNWSDNAISVTVYYNISDVDRVVKPNMELFFDKLKVFSGLPYSGHNFPQAPEEPISEEEYLNFTRNHPIGSCELCLDCDGPDNEPEDFGQCEAKGQCSDR
jgi:ribonucleoside-triphosphate reductase (thioredoxin)